jgi:hypothetical protein
MNILRGRRVIRRNLKSNRERNRLHRRVKESGQSRELKWKGSMMCRRRLKKR